MTLTRRSLITSLAAASLFPARDALAVSGEPFPVFESEAKAVPYKFRRRDVDFETGEPEGTIVVDPKGRFVYYVLGGGKATRYGASVGKAGKGWSGESIVKKMVKWPRWTPTPEHIAEHPDLKKYLPDGMDPGPKNPMGARALYLYQGEVDTVYRIHGTHDPKLVGRGATAGCFGLLNIDIIHLYGKVNIGTKVVVLAG
jgi:lipoprotein-anchoring transpeptidase ErfK/SrfK